MSHFDKSKTDDSIENPALSEKNERKPRTPGSMKDQIWIADDFDEPISEEKLALWYDGPIFPGDEIHKDQSGE